MKKIVLMVIAAMFIAAPANAQTDTESVSEAVSGLWTKAKQGVTRSTRRIKEEMDGGGLVDVDGHSYMHIYTDDLFRDSQAADFRTACTNAFKAKYPTVKILSVAIPQEEWTETTTRTLGRISKYVKTVYCYVLAQDGEDGYINARFSFRRVKKVGKSWNDDADNWPLWERTDVMTPSVYKTLSDM
ncbi:MAG: hypothetical protein K5893_12870 [Prevotella sp.]|nr:hypothetical protein [Prevotella sp.]